MKCFSSLKVSNQRSTSIGLVFAFMALIAYLGYLASRLTSSEQIPGISISTVERCILGLLVAAVVLCAYRIYRMRTLYAAVAVAGLIFALGFPYFSHIDEGGHFQYVHYIATRHALPSTNNYVDNEVMAMAEHIYPKRSTTNPRLIGLGGRIYEAHQPPLYYLLASIIYTAMPGNLIIKLYGLRIAGLLAVLLYVCVLLKAYRLLVEKNALQKNDALFFGTALLLTLTPGFLLRMTTLSNLHLLVPLESLLFYLLIKLSYETQFTFRRHILPLGLLSGATVLTHSVAAFVPLLVLAYIAIKSKSLRCVSQFIAVMAAVVSPWFIHNWLTFGQLTGQQAAKEQLSGIVNPTHVRYSLEYVVSRVPRMFLTFWQPEEIKSLSLPVRLLTDLISLILITAVVYGLVQAIRLLRNRKAGSWVPILCATAASLNWGMLIFASLHESFDVMIGRYTYQVMLPFALLIYLLLSKAPLRTQRALAIALVIAAALLWTSFFAGLLDVSTYRV